MIRNLIYLAIIASLILAFIMLWDTPVTSFNNMQIPETQKKQLHITNIIEDATTQRYSENGQLEYTFNATSTQHFQRNPKRHTKHDHTKFTHPKLVINNGDGSLPWHIHADKGKATNNQKIITLIGNVRIWQIDAAGNRSELETPELVVKPDAQYAETDKAVMMKNISGQTSAVGMKAFLKEDRVELLSQVRGIHEPQ